jgi:4-hydroxy-3-methylbut-2-en-1-yl diphosphate reductase
MTATRKAMTLRPPLHIRLCAPRGFCAGVVRAIDAVEKALSIYGAPVYVRHEIVHNRYVVDDLRAKGAIFVEDLNDVPAGNAPVIFSAHGVPKNVPEEAAKRHLFAIDATCPLVTKVHREAMIHHKKGRLVLLIGHKGHPEVVGTLGQLPEGAIVLIESVEDARSFTPPSDIELAYATQTTLSVDDTREIIDVLTTRFPGLHAPAREDICYATTNRQEAVRQIAPTVDAMIVVGSPNSSNSQRLREAAQRHGCAKAFLVERAVELDWAALEGLKSLGITAGASAPDILVDEMIDAFARHYDVKVESVVTREENMFFPLPRALRPAQDI